MWKAPLLMIDGRKMELLEYGLDTKENGTPTNPL
jgi:hypothetical protein